MEIKNNMLEIHTPYKDSKIGTGDIPKWTRGQFIKSPRYERVVARLIEMPLVNPEDHIDQNSDNNFSEFESNEVIATTGFHAEEMRSHGCGISATYMALRTISDTSFRRKFETVGHFTMSILSKHKNDSFNDGQTIIGTPVFNLRSGWYHDALVYSAIHEGRVGGFRVEDIPTLENIGEISAKLIDQSHNKIISIISVKNEFWRLKTERSSVSTHMVLVNGFDFDEEGCLRRIRVTDSYVSREQKINFWLDVTDNIAMAFTGKAIFFIGK